MSAVDKRINASQAKATAYWPDTKVTHHTEPDRWEVYSPNSGNLYAVFRYHGKQYTEAPPWYILLGCTCPTESSRLPICWHKTLIWMMLEEGELPGTR